MINSARLGVLLGIIFTADGQFLPLLRAEDNPQQNLASDDGKFAPKIPLERKEEEADAIEHQVTDWTLHLQNTDIIQAVPDFRSPFTGPQSLSPRQIRETVSLTLYLGRRLWPGASVYFNPEFFQGPSFNRTFGAAGFPNGEAQKAGKYEGELYAARYYFQQIIGFGGETEEIEDDQNQLADTVDISRLTVRFGKMSAADYFDNNSFSRDPRTQFMNWSIFASAAWDIPGDTKNYTNGLYLELNQKQWAVRIARYQITQRPGGDSLVNNVGRGFADVAEFEGRYSLFGHPGKIRLLGFVNRAKALNYRTAVDHPGPDGTPTTSDTQRFRFKYGGALNIEQELTSDLGAFLRLSINDGHTQSFDFTDVDQSAALGLTLKGTRWCRPDDVIGLAGAINGISNDHRAYFAAGGLGILVGDGQLKHYGPEEIIELYYSAKLFSAKLLNFGKLDASLSLDYQFLNNPGYNEDRGPANFFGARLHLAY